MGRRKKNESIPNDRCLTCQFYSWDKEKQERICTMNECKNNNKFQMYVPAWLQRQSKG